ncbi:MAG: HD domain-containing protein [Ruminobacter sp.]|nr:HD domain-containing protein [Ruminobacter sp.]
MANSFKKIARVINTNIDDSSIKYKFKILLFASSIIIFITALANLFAGIMNIALTKFLLLGIAFICLFLIRKQKLLTTALNLFTISTCAVFTYYLIIGGNDGTLPLWILLIPFTVITVTNIRYGITVCLVMELIIVTLCLTPAKYFLQYEYSKHFLISFPLIYTFDMILVFIIAYQLHKSKIQECNRLHELRTAVENERKKNETLTMRAIMSMSHAEEAKDKYTQKHSIRVAEITLLLAQKLNIEKEVLNLIYTAGMIHDIGKIGIPDSILNKPGRLTKEEFDVIKMHPTIGINILADFTEFNQIKDAILYHHERYDGKGYPTGLKGEDIPIIARILSVADAFDAMNSTRVYRPNLNKDAIIEQFEICKGTQFDPEIAQLMIDLIKSGEVEIDDIENINLENEQKDNNQDKKN